MLKFLYFWVNMHAYIPEFEILPLSTRCKKIQCFSCLRHCVNQ